MSDDESDVFGWTPEDRDDSPAVVSQPLASRHTSPLDPPRSDRTSLPLLQLADWDEELSYDEQPPTCVHYSIEWKLTLNHRSISKDTEPNLVLAPGPYWNTRLRPKVEKLAKKKLPSNRSFDIDDTDIAVCVNDRGERDLTKRFDGLNIDWRVVEKQLIAWSHLLLIGKRLRISLSFNYVEASEAAGATTRGRGGRSATASQLAERALAIDEEEAMSAQPAVWRRVYDLFRCTGSPCGLGPQCWVDTVAQERFPPARDNSTKKLILDLVSTHASTTPSEQDDDEEKLEVNDIIAGKGQGLVILLYGIGVFPPRPPGVGKTSTAETIAVATRKPLFSVSVADVGTKAKHVEANLSRIFSLATKWQAILLIDEADVFLESRGRGNMIVSTDKNALVSVFLRVLEYYQGIMFLTTNQIAQFDPAIPSRIHVAIRYESLQEDQMKAIFCGFLDKLNEDGLIEDYGDIKDWLEEVVYKEGFDGRQIRNIVKAALGLARAAAKNSNEPKKLTRNHLKRVFTNASAFKRDFNTQMQ
ncbi:AAA family, partial [Fusarium albosuccineum]